MIIARHYFSHQFLLISCAAIFVVLSLALYLLVPSDSAHLDLDSPGYDRVAQHFALTGKLIDPSIPDDMPIQMIGYPFFVGILYFLFGHSYFIVVLAQIFLMVLSGWLLCCAADQLFGKSVAAITIILATFNVGFFAFSQFILTETVLLTLLMAWFYYFVQLQNQPRIITAAKASFMLGFSALVKPIALFLFPLICLWLMIFLQCSKLCKTKIFCVSFIFFYIPVIGYMSYNKIMHNHFIVAPLMKESLYYYFLFRVVARIEHISVEEAASKTAVLLGTKNNHDDERWENAKKLLNEHMHKHPFIVMYVWLKNTLKTVGGLFSTQLKLLLNPSLKGGKNSFDGMYGSCVQRLIRYANHGALHYWVKIIALVELVWNSIRWLFVFIALLILFFRQRYDLLSFFIMIISFFVLITGHEGCARFRLPIEPFLISLTAFALYHVYNWYRKYKNKNFDVATMATMP